jgi:protein-disulfide isomerase
MLVVALGFPIVGSRGTEEDAAIVATVDGANVTETALRSVVGHRLLRIETELYQQRRRLLEDHIFQMLVAREAAARSMTETQLLDAEVKSRVKEATLDEAKAIYEATRERFGPMAESVALAQIQDRLREQRERERRARFAKELRQRANVRVVLEPPRASSAPQDCGPARGPASAPVTVFEFGDYGCQFCARVEPTLREVEERFGSKVRFAFCHLPLPNHGDAPEAVRASACADEQGRSWEMHAALFENQRDLGKAGLRQAATSARLDTARFEKCMSSGRHARDWTRVREQAAELGVTLTPGFLVNGRLLTGAAPLSAFSELIGDELERAATLVPHAKE